MTSLAPNRLLEVASRWLPPEQLLRPVRVRTDTTDFFRVEYGNVLILREGPSLFRHNAKEMRFGLDDEPKFWVKHAIDLVKGHRNFMQGYSVKDEKGNIVRILDFIEGKPASPRNGCLSGCPSFPAPPSPNASSRNGKRANTRPSWWAARAYPEKNDFCSAAFPVKSYTTPAIAPSGWYPKSPCAGKAGTPG